MARGRRSTTLALVLAVIALIGCAFVGGMADAKSDGAAFLAVRGERMRARDDGMVRLLDEPDASDDAMWTDDDGSSRDAGQ